MLGDLHYHNCQSHLLFATIRRSSTIRHSHNCLLQDGLLTAVISRILICLFVIGQSFSTPGPIDACGLFNVRPAWAFVDRVVVINSSALGLHRGVKVRGPVNFAFPSGEL